MSPESGWFEFDALLEVMPWGRNVYTVIRLDQALVEAAAAVRTRRVEGLLNGACVNLGINRADVLTDSFMYAGKALLKQLDSRAGDVVHCRLRPADPDHVPIPEDARRALAEVGRLAAFEAKSPTERRRLLQPLGAVRGDATRKRRIAALVTSLPTG